MEALELVL